MKKLKFLIPFVAVALCFILFSAPKADATFVIGESDIKGQLDSQKASLDSIENYIEYLKQQIIEGNPLAQEGLEKFLKLTKDEQSAFIKALSNPLSILDSLSNTNSAVLKAGQLEVPVSFVDAYQNSNSPTNVQPLASSRTVNASKDLYVFNIKTTTLYTTVGFEHNGSSATKLLTGSHSHSNINPAMIWTKGTGSSYLSSGIAYHRGDWTVYASGSLGFINDSVEYYVGGNASTRWQQFWSTHPNWTNTGWYTF